MKNNSELMTIKEFSEASGRSKQSIYKQINSRLTSYVKEIDGHKFIEKKALQEVFKITSQPKTVNSVNPEAYQSQPSQPKTVNSVNPEAYQSQPLYEILKAELEAKNRQIEELQHELAEERRHSREQSDKLAQLVDQAQRLHAATIKKQLPEGQQEGVTLNDNPETTEELRKKRGFFDWFKSR